MDFLWTEEQLAIKESARRFAEEKLRPEYQANDDKHVFDRVMLKEMGELGLIGSELSEKYGGLGLGYVTAGLITEEISRADFNVAYVQILAGLNGGIIEKFAAPHLAQKWITKIISGEALVAIALTEPSVGSDAANLKLKAERKGDMFVLNGEKTSISAAAQADVAVVFARTGTPEEKARGVSAFLVELDDPNIERTHFDDIGESIVGRGSLFFDNVEVPAENILGEEGLGFIQVMQGFDYSRALIGLQCLAAAKVSVDETWEHVRTREAFGKKISKFEGVSFPLAEAETFIEAATLLCYKTLWLRDQGQPHTAEAAMCKWWAPKVSFEIIHNCLLAHGHGGYSKDYPIQQRLRDVLGLQIGDGTSQIQKIVIAREKIGRDGVPY
ncbi:MAG: cyclohexanecarboxyl-CoA dehydrogenase [Piscirickettsiaceae bacterium]|nr:MAG: cyclohexanecarboxyl-CoA dehydrogenase [Piscirickettsiaceae bacterium]PCI68836.1 MAG: cyclohexanecarboxyl-CoA dehydrogenase [Piscirickettsiaceae bacterium]